MVCLLSLSPLVHFTSGLICVAFCLSVCLSVRLAGLDQKYWTMIHCVKQTTGRGRGLMLLESGLIANVKLHFFIHFVILH